MEESWWFCNEWECEYRKNEKHKNKMLCDFAWEGCPYELEMFEKIRERRIKNDGTR